MVKTTFIPLKNLEFKNSCIGMYCRVLCCIGIHRYMGTHDLQEYKLKRPIQVVSVLAQLCGETVFDRYRCIPRLNISIEIKELLLLK